MKSNPAFSCSDTDAPAVRRDARRILLTIAELCAALILLLSLGILIWFRIDHRRGQALYRETQQSYTAPAVPPGPGESAGTSRRDVITVDFAGLQTRNREIIAWLDYPALKISYPVLQAADNEKYLHTMYTGRYNRSGSIFLDAADPPDFQGAVAILYGHNMNNGTMFSGVAARLGTPIPADERLYIYLPGREDPLPYRPFAVCRLAEDDDFFFTAYTPGSAAYAALLQRLAAQSGDALRPDADRLLALSTCTKDGSARIVLFATREDG